MGRWRTTLMFSLILYCAGFITAVYVLAPPPETAYDDEGNDEYYAQRQTQVDDTGACSQQRIAAMRAGMDTVIHFAEEHAVKAIRALKARIAQQRQTSGQ